MEAQGAEGLEASEGAPEGVPHRLHHPEVEGMGTLAPQGAAHEAACGRPGAAGGKMASGAPDEGRRPVRATGRPDCTLRGSAGSGLV